MIPQLGHHIFLEADCAVVILGIRRVVRPTVGEHPLDVSDKQSAVAIVVRLQTFRHRPQVHRVLDVVVVIGHGLAVDRMQEGPGRLVILRRVQNRLERVVQEVGVVGASTV